MDDANELTSNDVVWLQGIKDGVPKYIDPPSTSTDYIDKLAETLLVINTDLSTYQQKLNPGEGIEIDSTDNTIEIADDSLTIARTTGLQNALDSKQDNITNGSLTIANTSGLQSALDSKLDTIADNSLTIAKTSGLQSALDSKQDTITNNSLTIARTSGLQSALDSKLNATGDTYIKSASASGSTLTLTNGNGSDVEFTATNSTITIASTSSTINITESTSGNNTNYNIELQNLYTKTEVDSLIANMQSEIDALRVFVYESTYLFVYIWTMEEFHPQVGSGSFNSHHNAWLDNSINRDTALTTEGLGVYTNGGNLNTSRFNFVAVDPFYYIDTLKDFSFELDVEITAWADGAGWKKPYIINFNGGNVLFSQTDATFENDGGYRGFSIYKSGGGFGIAIFKDNSIETHPDITEVPLTGMSNYEHTSFPVRLITKLSYNFTDKEFTVRIEFKDDDATVYNETSTITYDLGVEIDLQFLKHMSLGVHPRWIGSGTSDNYYTKGKFKTLKISDKKNLEL